MTYIILRDLFRLAIAGVFLTIFLVGATLACMVWLAQAGAREIAPHMQTLLAKARIR